MKCQATTRTFTIKNISFLTRQADPGTNNQLLLVEEVDTDLRSEALIHTDALTGARSVRWIEGDLPEWLVLSELGF